MNINILLYALLIFFLMVPPLLIKKYKKEKLIIYIILSVISYVMATYISIKISNGNLGTITPLIYAIRSIIIIIIAILLYNETSNCILWIVIILNIIEIYLLSLI